MNRVPVTRPFGRDKPAASAKIRTFLVAFPMKIPLTFPIGFDILKKSDTHGISLKIWS
jgi:hypothetical protein